MKSEIERNVWSGKTDDVCTCILFVSELLPALQAESEFVMCSLDRVVNSV